MAETKKAKKLPASKIKAVSDLIELFKSYPIVAAINMENLPARQLQVMRRTLSGTCVIRMTKRRLIKIAVDHVKHDVKGIDTFVPYLKGMPALLFTKDNPFKLYKIIEKNRSSAPAKPGQKAPKEIVVKAGPTNFAPGPIIGELGQVGIKAGIDAGKVIIKADSVVAKEGDVINPKLAALLTRLGIEPMEIGLNITAVFEKGVVYKQDVLAIDDKEFMSRLMNAASSSLNLAVEIAYPCKDTAELLVQKAFNNSKAVALEANFLADAVVGDLLAKAEAQASSLKAEAKQ